MNRSSGTSTVVPARRQKLQATPEALAGYEPDLAAAVELVTELMRLPGASRQERGVAEFIQARLLEAGVPSAAIKLDRANRLTPQPGEVGNLVCKLPGTMRGPRRVLLAHMDTVPLCVGTDPVREGETIRARDPKMGVGADDRAGVAVVLQTVLEILRRGLPHPPLTLVWMVQEELGLHGARHAQLNLWGKPQLAFNFDGGLPEKVTIGATGAHRLAIEIEGLASHAGGAPELGVSAIAIAGIAIAELARGGWHGDIRQGKRKGTSNIGYIEGGGATNVVTPHVTLRAEARSHDPKFRQRIVREIRQAFERAAGEVRSAAGAAGKVTIEGSDDYEAFVLGDEEPCVLAAEAAIRSLGLTPVRAISNGGLDANWLTARGIPTVTLGCGQRNPHTAAEYLDLPSFRRACQIGLRLATGTEHAGALEAGAAARNGHARNGHTSR
jgi:tripeptide aminopeptidase